jgi:hypothetical protein
MEPGKSILGLGRSRRTYGYPEPRRRMIEYACTLKWLSTCICVETYRKDRSESEDIPSFPNSFPQPKRFSVRRHDTESHMSAYGTRRTIFELMFGTIKCCSLVVIHKSHCVARLDLDDSTSQKVSQVVTGSLSASLVEIHV